MIGKLKVFLIMALLLPCQAWTASTEVTLRTFIRQNPESLNESQWIPALDEFIAFGVKAIDDPERDAFAEMAGYARYFAILGGFHQEFWRLMERKFKKADWPEQRILLEIARRGKDDTLAANLRQWSLTEEDVDRAVLLQQAAQPSFPHEAILDNMARSKSDLEEQWACYFATGNTSVVRAITDLLGNTTMGFCIRKGVDGQPIRELYPREKRLREKAWNDLAGRVLQDERLLQSLLGQEWMNTSPSGQRMAERLLIQALDKRQTVLAREILPMVALSVSQENRRLYYNGAMAQLENNERAVSQIIKKLEHRDRIWSERLRGYSALVMQKQREQKLRESAVPAGGKQLSLEASASLQDTKQISMCETWDLWESPDEDSPDVHFLQRFIAMDAAQRRFCMTIHSEPEVAWLLEDEETKRWNSASQSWTTVENRLIRSQIEDSLGLAVIRNFLADQIPTQSYQLQGESDSGIAVLVYRKPESSLLVDADLDAFFPNQKHTLHEVRFYIDMQTRRLLRMNVKLSVAVPDRPMLRGNIEKIFFAYDNTALDWAKDVH